MQADPLESHGGELLGLDLVAHGVHGDKRHPQSGRDRLLDGLRVRQLHGHGEPDAGLLERALRQRPGRRALFPNQKPLQHRRMGHTSRRLAHRCRGG
jgi:hypothetical protein